MTQLMIRRLIKRNAHAFTAVAVAWSLSSLFGLFDWRDAHRHFGEPGSVFSLAIWSVQILLVLLAVYFHRTEAPRELLWFGASTGVAAISLRLQDAAEVLEVIAGYVPELTGAERAKIVLLAERAAAQGEATAAIPIMFRGRRDQLRIEFEAREDDVLELSMRSHPDLTEQISRTVNEFQQMQRNDEKAPPQVR